MTHSMSPGTQCWGGPCSSLSVRICRHLVPSMYSATSGALAHAAHREVGNRQVEPQLKMAATFAEGSISPPTAWNTRVDPGVVPIIALAGVVMAVPFWQHPCQGQGRLTLRAPKGQSLQVGKSVWLMSEGLHSCNSVHPVCDPVFFNSATRVPVIQRFNDSTCALSPCYLPENETILLLGISSLQRVWFAHRRFHEDGFCDCGYTKNVKVKKHPAVLLK